MAKSFTDLVQYLRADWLVGGDRDTFLHLTTEIHQRLAAYKAHEATQQSPNQPPLRILLAETDPVQFLARLFAAMTTSHCHLFLGNPHWSSREWQQVLAQVQPDVVWCHPMVMENWALTDWTQGGGQSVDPAGVDPARTILHPDALIMVPTGGSSGQIRFVMHTWETLMTAVKGFQAYFQVQTVNSFCVLPLYHVSGLMQVLRSLTSGGRLVVMPFKTLMAGDRGSIDPADFFLSLVPTQLQRLLQNRDHARWLARFHTILLGGAPAWDELLTTARRQRLRLAPTYGMTETAAQIATLKPQDFLKGATSCGQVLPHVQIQVRRLSGESLNSLQPGTLTIQSAAVALGYYPQFFPQREFPTDDLGFVDSQGHLHIVGRYSEKIITGGENVYPAEVEAAIRATGFVQDICVIGLGDRDWGQMIIALYVPIQPQLTPTLLNHALNHTLSKFKRPKHWIALEKLPRNAQGKLNRPALEQLAQTAIAQLAPYQADH
jgi:o-succinylbenzoate---CoA ligase